MNVYFKTECYKAFRSVLFYVALGIGILCAVASTVYMLRQYVGEMGVGGILRSIEENGWVCKENILEQQTLYNCWMGADRQSLGAMLFYNLTPLLAALPCGWLFSEELHSGYLHMIVPRKDRRSYFQAKLLVSFLTGGITIVLPQMISILVVSMEIPAMRTSVINGMYTGIFHGEIFSSVFYAHPMIYIILILIMDFIFGGLFAWLSLTVAFFSHSRMAAVTLPFLTLLFIDSCKMFFYYINYTEISPLNLLHPMTADNFVKSGMTMVWMLILMSVTLPVILIKGCKYEIF